MTPEEAEAKALAEGFGTLSWRAWQRYALGLRVLGRGDASGRELISATVASGFVPDAVAAADLARFPDSALGALAAAAEGADAGYVAGQRKVADDYRKTENAEYDKAVEKAVASSDPNGALAAYELEVLGKKAASVVTSTTGALFSAFRTPILIVGGLAVVGIVGYVWFAKRATA